MAQGGRIRDPMNTAFIVKYFEQPVIIEYFGANALEVDGVAGTAIFQVDTNTALVTANAPVTISGLLSAVTGTAATAGGASAIKIGTSDVVEIGFGSGAPTYSAPQGSLYLRTDGSSVSTRMYVNTNGSTTWTNVTTAA